MKRYLKQMVAAASLSLFTSTSFAFDDFYNVFPDNDAVQHCYGFAMVGMDSVINSRIGVPAEHALELAKLNMPTKVGGNAYSTELLDNILHAYLWDGSPHSYAIKVFYKCAQSNEPMRSASSDVLPE